MENPGVWMMELDRFGYTLRVMGRTKEETEYAMRAEYIRTYAKINHLNVQNMLLALSVPIVDEYGETDPSNPYNEFAELFRAAFEDNEAHFYEFGKVEWE